MIKRLIIWQKHKNAFFYIFPKFTNNKTNVFIPTTYLMSRSFNQIALNIIIEIILIFLRVLLKMNN